MTLHQLALFPEYAQGQPLCHAWDRCQGERGRCLLGPVRRYPGCENRALLCLTCGVTGDLSQNLERRT